MEEILKYLIPAVIILAVLFWRVHIIFVCNSALQIKLRTFFINITLFESKSIRKPKKRKYTKRAIKKRYDKAEKALQKKRKKAAKASEDGDGKKFNFKFPDDVEDLLDALSIFFKELLSPVFRNTRLRFKRFNLTVASSDPADTAIRYGVISQSVAYFLAILEGNFKLSGREIRKVKIDCDFLAEKTTFDLHMYISVGVWKFIYILIRGAIKLFKRYTKFKAKKDPNKQKNKKNKIC